MTTNHHHTRRPLAERVNARVPDALLGRVDEHAARIGITRQAIIREALADWCDAEDDALGAAADGGTA
jgi:predicted transcriptional regulator